MKLNHDCVRDMLLYLENNLYDKSLKIRSIASDFEKHYTLDEIVYTFQKLQEAGFIKTGTDYACTKHSHITSITWKGHNFIDNIRDTKVISLAKKALKDFKSVSIEALASVCSDVIINCAKNNI